MNTTIPMIPIAKAATMDAQITELLSSPVSGVSVFGTRVVVCSVVSLFLVVSSFVPVVSIGLVVVSVVVVLSGCVDGSVIGSVVGCVVGCVVGSVDGSVVGCVVGSVDGLVVGCVVGSVDGSVVGFVVGSVVGFVVGSVVGLVVGSSFPLTKLTLAVLSVWMVPLAPSEVVV